VLATTRIQSVRRIVPRYLSVLTTTQVAFNHELLDEDGVGGARATRAIDHSQTLVRGRLPRRVQCVSQARALISSLHRWIAARISHSIWVISRESDTTAIDRVKWPGVGVSVSVDASVGNA
jgi:hypothetical protein